MNELAHQKLGRQTRRGFAERLRVTFRPRRPKHDPLLVLNLATFNAGGGWAQVLNPLKVRESVG